eukprot:CAMPEP_0178719188 /NCGR_PEP_ID=MMETSP0699-20121125/22995_1 /TAXON_ID=265572 /ORGANISM="Extubocellulus spinifer, Strain CCMP396" /LENGTH=134 /DNA_ID=CAMNT_0020369415 /DNA_START=44 /DNA_END=448 /DNA_ORIENTATION=-
MYNDESHCTYCLEGSPEGCARGACSEEMAAFVEVLSQDGSSFHAADFDYLIAVHDTTTYRFANFFTTHLGCHAVMTGIATTSFNAEGKVVEHTVMSLDAPQVLQCIGEFYEWKQKQNVDASKTSEEKVTGDRDL